MNVDTVFNIENEIRNNIREIWSNEKYKDFCVYTPTAPKNILKNSLLFIGINPSRLNGEKPTPASRCEVDFYQTNQTADYPYFKKFVDISEHCQIAWSHLDLLYFRETNQNKIHDILEEEVGRDFIWEQLKITDKLIKAASPKVIIVSNALAAKFLGKDQDKILKKNVWLGYDLVFDNTLGTYIWNNTPVFFSSMLTGQRALDNGSYERLKWHIKKAIAFKSDNIKT